MTKMHDLAELGQAVWLDYIRRSFTASGKLGALVEQGLRGVTSNPSIFDKAIAGSDDYDEAFKKLVEAGCSVEEIYERLVVEDIQEAADALRPVYDQSGRADGFVSLEVSPTLAYDTQSTMEDARRLFGLVGRPNVMIKVPATPEGIPAIETLIGEGININITLMFSLAHYDVVAEAYFKGLEKLAAAGGDLSKVASVASFFVSRVDTAVDKALGEKGNTALLGKIAVANTKVTYARFEETFDGPRWQALADQGARVQRPLWASTSTKNPAYSDTLYVDNLIGPHTVNTMPPATLEAFLDHGRVATTIGEGLDEAHEQLAALAGLGIDLDAITEKLQVDGVAAFEKSFDSLMASITKKQEKM
jgi:transaldolase